MTGRGRTGAAILTAVLAAIAPAGRAQTLDGTLVARGAEAFHAGIGCGNCHFKDSTFAPPLEGVAGRKIAGVRGFLYSAALKSKGGKWTDANLDAFLSAPQTFAPGTGMDAGIEDSAQRKAVIAYIKTLK